MGKVIKDKFTKKKQESYSQYAVSCPDCGSTAFELEVDDVDSVDIKAIQCLDCGMEIVLDEIDVELEDWVDA